MLGSRARGEESEASKWTAAPCKAKQAGPCTLLFEEREAPKPGGRWNAGSKVFWDRMAPSKVRSRAKRRAIDEEEKRSKAQQKFLDHAALDKSGMGQQSRTLGH